MNDENALAAVFLASELKHAVLSGDVAGAEQARASLGARFHGLASAADVQEFHCNVKNIWEELLFHALLKRYGIRPYRYRKQRRSTIMVRISKQFMDQLLWPIFLDVSAALTARFTEVTTGLLPSIAAGPYPLAILEHDHGSGELCENCRRKFLEQA